MPLLIVTNEGFARNYITFITFALRMLGTNFL